MSNQLQDPDCVSCPFHSEVCFDRNILEHIKARDFADGLSQGEFRPLFQPVVDQNGSPLYFELLMRWDRQFPCIGNRTLGPQVFCALAERLGRSVDLWRFAVARAERFIERLDVPRQFRPGVAINIAPADMADPQVEVEMYELARRHEQGPCPISFELTEGFARHHDIEFFERICRLQSAGIRFAIDDFGSGYSSLARIRMVRADTIKIDKAFLAAVTEDARSCDMLRLIVQMCHLAGAYVIAEGIENAHQRDIALIAGCDGLQGFYYSVPMCEFDAIEWARRRLVMPINAESDLERV